MAPEIPSNLIRDIQIRLRRAAGVPSYDPGDPSIPSVPSVGEAVAALDPSFPNYLRCKSCHGGLCRGTNSTLCIFCGVEQIIDGISHTISFSSTAGCRDFLQSLSLDGSETVILETESKDSRSVHESPKGRVALSNLLDLELRWPRELEKIDNSSNSKAPKEAPVSLSRFNLENFYSDQKNEFSSRPRNSDATSNISQVSAHDVNLSSGDFDSFFSGTRNETASCVQNTIDKQFMPKEQDIRTQVKLSSRSQKFGCFEGHQSVDVINNSSDAKGGELDDAFADWETDFQSASSAPSDDKSKHHNSADIQSANPAAVTMKTKTIDRFQNPMDYQFANSETVATDSRRIDPVQNSATFQSDNTAVVTMESRTIDLLPYSVDLQVANSETGALESRHIDLFQNSSDGGLPNCDTLATGSRQIALLQNFATESYSYPMTKSMSDNGMNTVPSSSENGSSIKDLIHEGDLHAHSNDWFQNDLWSQIKTKKSKEANKVGSSINISNGEVKSGYRETTFDGVNWTPDDLWLVSSADEISNIQSEIHHDDFLFDDWQDFTTSTKELGNLSNLQAQSNKPIFHGHSSEAKSEDLDEIEFGSFKRSGIFSGALDGLQSSSYFKTGERDVSIVQRTSQNNEKTENASAIHKALEIGENTADAYDTDTSNVDKLLARMPDLSFMLEETLSIPKKPSSSDLNA